MTEIVLNFGRILVGDATTELRKLPPESVHCCVTSPPYWGLRDYGTRSWFGGDPACEHDHEIQHGPHHPGQVEQTISGDDYEAAGKGGIATTSSCSKCGAWYGQLGLEPTPEGYVTNLVEVLRQVHRVLHPSGTLWLNIGDSYAAATKGSGGKGGIQPGNVGSFYNATFDLKASGLKAKDLVGIPWMVAFALRKDGWWLRSDIIWAKSACMPESITDRPTRSHEYIFLLSKRERYFYDQDAIREPMADASLDRYEYDFGGSKAEQLHAEEGVGPGGRTHVIGDRIPHSGRNKRSVWHIGPQPYKEAHFATFPEALPETCIKAGTSEKGCCPTCKAPWERIVETNNPSKEAADDDARDWANTHQQTSNPQSSKSLHRNEGGVYPTVKTLGWKPTCSCPEHEPEPCVVLDPFSGSGTTAAVAASLYRRYIGCELNPEYAKLIQNRLDEPDNKAFELEMHDLMFSGKRDE